MQKPTHSSNAKSKQHFGWRPFQPILPGNLVATGLRTILVISVQSPSVMTDSTTIYWSSTLKDVPTLMSHTLSVLQHNFTFCVPERCARPHYTNSPCFYREVAGLYNGAWHWINVPLTLAFVTGWLFSSHQTISWMLSLSIPLDSIQPARPEGTNQCSWMPNRLLRSEQDLRSWVKTCISSRNNHHNYTAKQKLLHKWRARNSYDIPLQAIVTRSELLGGNNGTT
jgi:hypothetical protein